MENCSEWKTPLILSRIQLLSMLKRDGRVVGAGERGKTTYLCKYLFSAHVILFHAVLPGIYLRSTAVHELPGNGIYKLRYYYI